MGNKYALGLTTSGRPPMYSDAKELGKKISAYFESLKGEGDEEGNARVEFPTITGLALFLGFCSRQSIYDYANKEDEFSYIVKRAMLAIEHHYETRLNYQSPTGAIFALKNMNWSDKSEVEHSGGIKTTYSDLTEEEIQERLERIRNRP